MKKGKFSIKETLMSEDSKHNLRLGLIVNDRYYRFQYWGNIDKFKEFEKYLESFDSKQAKHNSEYLTNYVDKCLENYKGLLEIYFLENFKAEGERINAFKAADMLTPIDLYQEWKKYEKKETEKTNIC